jgi:hypothetical protein
VSKHEDDFLSWEPEVIEATVPGTDQTVHLRYPAFDVWHAIATEHRECVGRPASAALVAKTIAGSYCKKNGEPLFTADSLDQIMRANPNRVMWLYNHALKTVFKNDDEAVSEVEKNSAAGQD